MRQTRTFRIDEKVLKALEIEASKENRSPNNLLETILKKHFNIVNSSPTE